MFTADMDYEKFKSEFDLFQKNNSNDGVPGVFKNDDLWFDGYTDNVVTFGSYKKSDSVNSPAHYTRGRVEAIEVIEDAIKDAPSPVEGMLQAQVLKYLLRLWVKSNSTEDAQKAQWYLNRLVDQLSKDA